MKLRIDAASSIGGRPSQDDCLVIGERPVESPPAHTVPPIFIDTDKSPFLAAVLDGVGSCAYAGLASSMTAAKIQTAFYSNEGNEQFTAAERLGNACEEACEKLSIFNHSFGSIDAATTITAAAFSKKQLHLWATGDSPAYLYRKHTLRPLFETMSDGGNRLLAFAGGPNTDFITSTYDLEADDAILLSTDGILKPKMLLWALRLGLSARTIVRLSTLRRFGDNATLILIKIVEV